MTIEDNEYNAQMEQPIGFLCSVISRLKGLRGFSSEVIRESVEALVLIVESPVNFGQNFCCEYHKTGGDRVNSCGQDIARRKAIDVVTDALDKKALQSLENESTYKPADALLEIVAEAITDMREAILTPNRDPFCITAFDNGQLIGSITIAKDIARKLPVEKQRAFLAACGIPNATL